MAKEVFLKKDGTPYKNQGCHPFEQKIVYAIHMAKHKKKTQTFYIEFKDSKCPNGFYTIESYSRDSKRKMFVHGTHLDTDTKHSFCWDYNNLVVLHRQKKGKQDIVVWQETTPVVLEAEFIEDQPKFNAMDLLRRFVDAELQRKMKVAKLLENI